MREVGIEEARRIAVRAQGLDCAASGVLDTVRRLGFLQLDPISSVAPPQHLVLWSRLGAFDTAALDRLLWQERKLVEWRAFLYPSEDLPMLKAFMRRRDRPLDRRIIEWIKARAAYRRHVLKELRERGPLLSREIADAPSHRREDHRWWGQRQMGLMLELLAARGQVAVVGRRGKQRVWDLAERWYPETETLPLAKARRLYDEKRFRALGVRLSAAGSSRIRRPRTARFPSASRSSLPSTGSSTTAPAPRRSGTSSTGSRCTCRRRSASTATTSSPSSTATASSAESSLSSTGRPAGSTSRESGGSPARRSSTWRSLWTTSNAG